ncbi:DUF952 domain-containing protein [Tardiphaga robiniae]|uniref:DUF952 domain-containing protein n=1 Tax=Tardiphaga robiniae TaxID=943830 RepID=A0A161SRJ9_9BRAD|nr:DUF952 domain-containing protein [Tardiphaga robiniae]KZD23832.1 hypothetical protein A4A58_25795 [Tardiphaga robiniae]
MNEKPLLHIVLRSVWIAAEQQGQPYKGNTFETEGFIHCSTPEQVIEVANYLYHGIDGLILLKIDPSKVTSPIRYEDAGNGKLYPHIYGPLDLEAIVGTIDFTPRADGTFAVLK